MQLPEMEKDEAETLGDHQSDVAATGLVQLFKKLGVSISALIASSDRSTTNSGQTKIKQVVIANHALMPIGTHFND